VTGAAGSGGRGLAAWDGGAGRERRWRPGGLSGGPAQGAVGSGGDGCPALMASGRAYLDGTPPSRQADRLRRHVRTGRPLGDEKLLAAAGKATGRKLRRKRTRSGQPAASERNG
jgi:hypothetical protein